MDFSKIKQFTLVEIDWLDSIHESGWMKFSNFNPQEEQMRFKTVGYIVHKSKTALAVAQSYGLNRKDPGIDAVMQIPTAAILKVRKLK